MRKLTLLLIVLPSLLFSQNFEYKNYDWESTAVYKKLSISDSKESFITLKNLVVFEFLSDSNGGFCKYETNHTRIRLNDEKAIAAFNKYIIGTGSIIDIIEIKARVIQKDGKTNELDKRNIQDINNYENRGPHKVIAIDGLVSGSEIEILYKLKKSATLFGSIIPQQEQIVKNFDFKIITPKYIVFTGKSYNHCANFNYDTLNPDNRIMSIHMDSIPSLIKEDYANYNANRMRIEYKFNYNTQTSRTPVYSWTYAAQRYIVFFQTTDQSTEKQIKKLYAKLDTGNGSEEEKIKAIEKYIKNEYAIKELDFEGIDNIDNILKNKFSNKDGLTLLFFKFLKAANIKFQPVITCSRSEYLFDKDYMSWNYLTDYLFYFPSLDIYLSPTKPEYRYGIFPEELAYNYGLFLKEDINKGGFSVVPEIKYIKPSNTNFNQNNLRIKVSFPPSMDKANLDIHTEFGGHHALFIAPYYEFLTDQKKKEVSDNIFKLISDNAEIIESRAINTDHNKAALKEPFTLEGKLSVTSILVKKGDKFVFKIGDLIGRQMEMYQDSKRVSPIDLEYVHSYNREIIVHIPDGYTVSGLDKLKINKIAAFDENEKSCGFISDFTISGNLLTVKITEFYNAISYPASFYENFRKVVNASADFNKIALIFEKK